MTETYLISLLIPALALGILAFLLVRRPVLPTPVAASAAALAAAAIETRVTALEAAFPEWRLGMAKLADECESLLVATESKRRQVQATEARVAKKRAALGDEGVLPVEAVDDESGDAIANGSMLPFRLTGDRALDKARLRKMRTGG